MVSLLQKLYGFVTSSFRIATVSSWDFQKASKAMIFKCGANIKDIQIFLFYTDIPDTTKKKKQLTFLLLSETAKDLIFQILS